MPRESNPQLSNAHENEVNAASASAGSTPEAKVTSTVPNLRKEKTRSSKFSWGWGRESTGR
jgi:hypothetical protein